MLVKIDGELFWLDVNGHPIGPLNPERPTCGDNNDGE